MATRSSILAWKIPWTEAWWATYSPQGHNGSDITEYSYDMYDTVMIQHAL